MSDLVIELSQQAQTLQPLDRARLAELLLDSIHLSMNSDVQPAWDDEILCRVDEIDSGVATLVPANEVFAQIRRAIQ